MDLDTTDRAILYLLQKETRTNITYDEIAERIDVSSSTVSNRIRDLEERGILEGHKPEIDYEAAGIPHRIVFVCTAPISERMELAEQAIDVDGVVGIRELVTGTENLHIEVVHEDTEGVETTAEKIDELGIERHGSEILRRTYDDLFDDFGAAVVDGERASE